MSNHLMRVMQLLEKATNERNGIAPMRLTVNGGRFVLTSDVLDKDGHFHTFSMSPVHSFGNDLGQLEDFLAEQDSLLVHE